MQLFVAQAETIGHLILRNVDAAGAPSKATVRAIRAGRAVPAPIGSESDAVA